MNLTTLSTPVVASARTLTPQDRVHATTARTRISRAATVLASQSLEIDQLDQNYEKIPENTYTLAQLHDELSSRPTEILDHQYYVVVRHDHLAQAKAYLALQHLIAKKIPHEYQRPIIDIKFVFGQPTRNSQVVGILGGIGPIADADLATRLVEKIKTSGSASNLMIHVFSSPPPRTNVEKLLGGAGYILRLDSFLKHGYAAYYLASNTAHLNFDYLDGFVKPEGGLQNLVETVVNTVALDRNTRIQNDPVLILGTKESWQGKLYQDLFDNKSMAYISLTDSEIAVVDDAIHDIKSGQSPTETARKFAKLVKSLSAKYQTTNILLGCTELSTAMAQAQQTDRVLQTYTFYDSQQIFAHTIASQSASLAR